MKEKPAIIFYDGRAREASAGFLEALRPGQVRGVGVFETIRASGGQVLFFKRHVARCQRAVKYLRLHCPYSPGMLKKQIHSLLRRNNLKEARVRLSVWKDAGETHTALVAEAYRPYSRRQFQKGLHALFARRVYDGRKPSYIKSLDYGDFLKAGAMARRKGYDEAILVNQKGFVAEGARTNVFFMRRGKLYTPALCCGGLKGIARQRVMELARCDGVPCRAVCVRPEVLSGAEEVFLTNALIGIMPLTRLDKKLIGQGKPGAWTARWAAAYAGLPVAE